MTEIIELSSPPSSSESNESPEFEVETLFEGLDECLTNIQPSGSFALFEGSSNPPNPGLYLRCGGGIGLPLSDRDAQAIVAASHQAPFGKGEETIVDTSVRNTWEISPNEFEIKNPAWQPFVESIVTKVSVGLGVDATGKGVTAELYKLLLYEEGAMFKPHQDSEKAPRMFATLVIALPSKHEGGEVRVTHAGKTHIFETSKYSDFSCSYLSWFADVTHEVKPVRSGRRLVLTYNLVHTTLSKKELGADSNKAMAKLRLLFSRWRDNVEDFPTHLGFLFDHQYTDASLCYDDLKGHDLEVASYLRQVCTEYGFFFYLASLERSITGGCDEDDYWAGKTHEIFEETDRDTYLKRVVDLDGAEIARDLDFDDDRFIQSEPFEKLEPDDEDCSGFTGNEGVNTTHFYHRTMAILVHKSQRMEFLLSPNDTRDLSDYNPWSPDNKRGNPDVLDWINRLTNELSLNPGDERVQDELEQICKMVLRRTKAYLTRPIPTKSWQMISAPFSDEVITRIITTTIELNNKTLFVDAYDSCSLKTDLPIFRSVGCAILRYDLESLLPKLKCHFDLISSFSQRYNAIEELREGLQTEANETSRNPAAYLDWLKSETDRAISTMTMSSAKDAMTLVDISKQVSNQKIFNKILPAVKRNASQTLMAFTFLVEIHAAIGAGEITDNVVHAIFKDVVTDMAPHFTLQSIGKDAAGEVSNKRIAGSFGYHGPPQTPEPSTAEDHETSRRIADFLCIFPSLGLGPELEQVTSRLANEAARIHINIFQAIYLPLLKRLTKAIEDRNISIEGSPFQRLYQQLLCTYIVRFVKEEPVTPKNWTRPTVSCSCDDCLDLSAFLSDPLKDRGRFTMGQKKRQHLEYEIKYGLGHSDIKTDTDKKGSTHTLVVTKTKAQYNKDHKDWAQRCAIASKHLQGVGKKLLRPYLSETYEAVMSLSSSNVRPFLETLQGGTQLPVLTEKESASNRVLPPITKRKIPAEVIVLDD